jgi:hypothetical protein
MKNMTKQFGQNLGACAPGYYIKSCRRGTAGNNQRNNMNQEKFILAADKTPAGTWHAR